MSAGCNHNAPTVFKDDQFVCGECDAVLTSPDVDMEALDAEIDRIFGHDDTSIIKGVCECGSERAGYPNCHTTWCPLFGR